jgi:hypothetical protein
MIKNASFGFAVFLILLYSAIQVVLLIHHEPWQDEAQAWLIARDLDIVSIFKQMAYEGTPALWHMLLVPFAKTGLPYISEFILHLVIAVAAVTIFVLYAPFSKLTKVLFIFSYYMAYEYSIIARSYSLSIFFLFLIAALYNKRFEHPLLYSFPVFLLFNTNVHSFFIASSLTILFVWELYRNHIHGGMARIAVFIMSIGGLLCFLQLLSPPDNINYRVVSDIYLLAPLVSIANAFFPWHSCNSFILIESRQVFIIVSFLIFAIMILSLNRKPPALFILLLSVAGLSYVFAFKYPGEVRHHGLILIMVIFAMWIGRYYSNSQNLFLNVTSRINFSKISIVLINACLAVSLLYCLRIQYLEYKYLFSGSKEMADFIKNKQLNRFTVVAHRSCPSASLLPYFNNKTFWYADIEDYGTFITFNQKYFTEMNISNKEVISRMHKSFPDRSKLLLLLLNPLDFPESYGFRLLYSVDKNIFGYGRETFYLYKPITYEL